MAVSKPNINTYFTLGVVVVILLGGLIYFLNHFVTQRTFGMAVYLTITTLLTLAILLLLVKMMASFKFLSLGNEQITTRFPLKGQSKTYRLDQVLVWEEEKIMSNKRMFKQLTIVFDDRMSFSISNHEHINYEECVKYMEKKLGKKKITNIKKTSPQGKS